MVGGSSLFAVTSVAIWSNYPSYKNAGFQLFLTEVKNEGIRGMNLVCSKLAILKPGHCKWFSYVASTVISG